MFESFESTFLTAASIDRPEDMQWLAGIYTIPQASCNLYLVLLSRAHGKSLTTTFTHFIAMGLHSTNS